ncbi:hypothetical protein ACFL5L_04400 [candidate division KSB1 bacterium]
MKKKILRRFTISREFGCTGFTLGELLAEKLNKHAQIHALKRLR